MDGVPAWLQAGFRGLLAGGALLVGAFVGYRLKVPQRVSAAIMAFGSGVLISALSFELMEHAFHTGGLASTAIGLSMLGGRGVSMVAVAAIFLSNIPEGPSSAAGMKQAGRSVRYVFGIWGGIALASGVAALLGYAVFRNFPPEVVAATTAVAAGGILAMLVDTMIPEAFEQTHDFAGLIVVAGLLTAFALSKLGG